MRRPYFAATDRRSISTARGDERLVDLVRGSERVPATLLLPPGARSAPATLLLHGFSSSNERMVESVGRALQRRGVASLALDLPFHGERDGGREEIPHRSPLALVAACTTAVREAQAERLFAYAEEPKELHWYEGGHWPPASAIEDAAAWTADRLRAVGARRQAG